jgi:hypothetical protein
LQKKEMLEPWLWWNASTLDLFEGVNDSGTDVSDMPFEQDAWQSLMRRGDYAQAWRISDQVLAARDPSSRDDPRLPYHLRWVWDGSSFTNRHVLVRCYHGLGDTLQFARYLPVLGNLAASLTVEVQPKLIPLLSTLENIDRLVPFVLDAPPPPSECDIEIMELLFALKETPGAVTTPYFHSVPAPLPAGTLGLCWQGGGWELGRAIPDELFRPFTSRPCVTLVPAPTQVEVLNPEGCPREIKATAELIAGVDLVITVDTMVAHLAGALHHPVWLLLKHEADWRWMVDRDDSPWYPSMRLYRQPVPGDWASVLKRVSQDLPSRPLK